LSSPAPGPRSSVRDGRRLLSSDALAAACILARVRERRRDALIIFLAALLARAGVVVWAWGRFPAVEDGRYYDVLARRVASGAGYTWLWPDGAVTYVAHYPVGYPALVAAGYALFGARTPVAMAINAVLGAAGAYAAHRLVDGAGIGRWRPFAAGAVVALHPALVPYTAALMTEGVTASLLLVAAALVMAARGGARRWEATAGAGIVLGVATLVRPQCLALAPVLGALALPEDVRIVRRVVAAAVVSTIALACVLPWTARNCARMNRCALVSVNGGWNLLIGATTETGSWEPMPVPAECATVWDESGKDACFERAAWRDIGRSPTRWLARAPAKLAATFDYFGAAPWYLHASNATAFDEHAKMVLGAVETIVCRLLLLGALVACGRLPGKRARLRKGLAMAGAIAAVTLHGWVGYAAVPVVAACCGVRALARGPVLVPIAAVVIGATAAIHAVFFGAGRYGLVVAPFVALLAFVPPGRGPTYGDPP
jgi:4-amino-4-deoxy-L-arabinose transferase-like glycosyltransferase